MLSPCRQGKPAQPRHAKGTGASKRESPEKPAEEQNQQMMKKWTSNDILSVMGSLGKKQNVQPNYNGGNSSG